MRLPKRFRVAYPTPPLYRVLDYLFQNNTEQYRDSHLLSNLLLFLNHLYSYKIQLSFKPDQALSMVTKNFVCAIYSVIETDLDLLEIRRGKLQVFERSPFLSSVVF